MASVSEPGEVGGCRLSGNRKGWEEPHLTPTLSSPLMGEDLGGGANSYHARGDLECWPPSAMMIVPDTHMALGLAR